MAAVNGFGRHAHFLSDQQLILAKKYSQLAVLAAIFAKCAIKLSICFFLLVIIRGTHRRFVLAIRILMGLTIATSFICALLWGLQARPIEALWDPSIPGSRQSPEQFLDSVYVIYGKSEAIHWRNLTRGSFRRIDRLPLRDLTGLFLVERADRAVAQAQNLSPHRIWTPVSAILRQGRFKTYICLV